MENRNAILRSLKSLAELHVDRKEGYKKAHEELGDWDLDLKAVFESQIIQSEAQKKELDILLTQFGENDVKSDESFLAQMHQTWIEIKTAFVKKDREAILSSCEFGENVIIGAYETSIKAMESPSIKVSLERQLAELRAAKSTITGLRKLSEAM